MEVDHVNIEEYVLKSNSSVTTYRLLRETTQY